MIPNPTYKHCGQSVWRTEQFEETEKPMERIRARSWFASCEVPIGFQRLLVRQSIFPIAIAIGSKYAVENGWMPIGTI